MTTIEKLIATVVEIKNIRVEATKTVALLEQAASELSAFQKEVAELKEQVKWRKEHMEESDKELVQIQDWLRAGGDVFISSSEMMARVKERIRDLIAIEGEAGDLRTQNRELKELCKVKDEALKTFIDTGDFMMNVDQVFVARASAKKALALQPEK